MLEEFIFFIFVSNPTMRKGRSQTFFVFFVFVFFVFFVFFFFFFERKRGKLRSFQVSFQLTQKEVGVVETNSFEPSRRYSFRRVPSNGHLRGRGRNTARVRSTQFSRRCFSTLSKVEERLKRRRHGEASGEVRPRVVSSRRRVYRRRDR